MFRVKLMKITANEESTLQLSANTMTIMREVIHGQMPFGRVKLGFNGRQIDMPEISQHLYDFLGFLDRSENNVRLMVIVHCLDNEQHYLFRDAVVNSIEWSGDLFENPLLEMTLAFRSSEYDNTSPPRMWMMPPPIRMTPLPVFVEESLQNLDWRKLGF